MKFLIKDFFSKCNQIPRKLRIWSHLLKKSLFVLCKHFYSLNLFFIYIIHLFYFFYFCSIIFMKYLPFWDCVFYHISKISLILRSKANLRILPNMYYLLVCYGVLDTDIIFLFVYTLVFVIEFLFYLKYSIF